MSFDLAERSVIGDLLCAWSRSDATFQRCWLQCATLTPADFGNLILRQLYQTLVDLVASNMPCDPATVVTRAPPGLLTAHQNEVYLVQLSLDGVPDPGVVAVHVEAVRRASLRRQQSGIVDEIQRRLRSAGDVDGLVSQLGTLQRAERDLGAIRAVSISVLDFQPLLYEPPPLLIPSSLAVLTQALGGGYQTRAYGLLSGPTKHGKSAFTVQEIRAFAAQGWPVLVATVEMPRQELLARLASQRRPESWRRIMLEHFTPDQSSALGAALDGLAHVHHLQFKRGMTLLTILDEVKRLTDHYGRPIVVILDYLQRIVSRAAAGSSREGFRLQAEVSDLLAESARDLNACFLVLSAVRSSLAGMGDKADRMSNDELVGAAKEGGGVEYDAAVNLLLRRGKPAPDAPGWRRASLRVTGQRHADQEDPLRLLFDGAHNVFVHDVARYDDEDLLPKEVLTLLAKPVHRRGLTMTEIYKHVGGKKSSLTAVLGELLAAKKIWRPDGKRGVAYRLAEYAPSGEQVDLPTPTPTPTP